MKPANFSTRILTAIILGILMITSILLGALYFALLMLVVHYIGMNEFYKLIAPGISEKSRITGIITGSILFTLIFIYNAGWLEMIWLWLVPVLLFSPFIIALFDKRKSAVNSIGASLSGFIFLALPLSLFASMILLGDNFIDISGSEFVLMFLIILWVFDSLAYIAGSYIGKRKLCERLSPGKTWEGSIGGLIFGLATAWGISFYYTTIPAFHWIALALLITVFGTLGDLCESLLKRNAGVKDSGRILPGHGGILDRFDAVLMSAPVVYFYTVFFII